MKRILLSISLLTVLTLFAFQAHAQFENAVTWETQVKSLDNGLLAVNFTATLDPGLHLYAAQQPEGSFAMPTTFDLDESLKGVELVGGLADQGNKITAFDDIMKVDQSYFDHTAKFEQKLKSSEGMILEGVLSYQVCDDEKCVPFFRDISLDLSSFVK